MVKKSVCENMKNKIEDLQKEVERLRSIEADFKFKEEQYEKAEEICNYGHWSRDYTANKGVWSKNTYRIFGVTPDQFYPTTENFLFLIHPSDRKFVEKSFTEASAKCKSLDIEYRVVRPDRTERVIHSVAEPIFISNEKCSQLFGTVQDVTDRRRAEEVLQKTENQFTTVFHSNPAAIAITRIKDNRLVEINKAWEQKTGITRDEAIGRTTFDLGIWVNPEMRKQFVRHLRGKGELKDVEAELKTKSGKLIHMLMSGQYINFGGEECLLTMGQDITESKRMETELRTASFYARNLIEASLDPLVTISPNGKIMDVNKATENVTEVSRKKLIGSDFSEYFTEPEKAREGYKQVLSDGTVKDYPLSIRHRDGSITDVLYNASIYKNEAGEVQGVFATARDITIRRKAEKGILESERKLRILSSKLISSQEEERKRISLELHDEMGQTMTVIMLKLKEIEKELSAIISPIIKEKLDEMELLVDQASEQVRKMSFMLRPAMLDDLGLVPTLRWNLNGFSKRTNIDVKFETNGFDGRLDHLIETVLYRVVQECLNNIAKHAEAKNVFLQLKRKAKTVTAVVQDDGKGFDVEKIMAKEGLEIGIGLMGMNERISMIGGNISIESHEGQGTMISIKILLK